MFERQRICSVLSTHRLAKATHKESIVLKAFLISSPSCKSRFSMFDRSPSSSQYVSCVGIISRSFGRAYLKASKRGACRIPWQVGSPHPPQPSRPYYGCMISAPLFKVRNKLNKIIGLPDTSSSGKNRGPLKGAQDLSQRKNHSPIKFLAPRTCSTLFQHSYGYCG